jgi:hypothetical protein
VPIYSSEVVPFAKAYKHFCAFLSPDPCLSSVAGKVLSVGEHTLVFTVAGTPLRLQARCTRHLQIESIDSRSVSRIIKAGKE